MRIGENIRRKSYFFLDKLRGGVVRKYLNEFDKLNNDVLKKSKNKDVKLNRILKHAVETTSFYSEFDYKKGLSAFPVISKQLIRENYNKFCSSLFLRKDLIPVHTSGSYGVPFTFYLTHEKKYRQHAEVIYYGRWCGYDVGVKHAYIRSTPFKSFMKKWMQNEVFYACEHLNDDFISSSLSSLKKDKIQVIIGFPSAIAYLASASIAKGLTPRDYCIEGVITSSENLTDSHRKIIKQAFGCIVNSRYSTEEFGVLANECIQEKGFHINDASYYIEVLKINSDEEASPGEVGRLVVTDFFSYAMPLIRYEVGDLGIISDRKCSCGIDTPMLEQFSGRTMQILLDTKGNKLFPMAFDTVMEVYPEFLQYQIIQETEKSYKLNIVLQKNDVVNIDEIAFRLRNWLGSDANIKINIVDEIEQLPSGKRPYIINNYKNISVN